MSKAGEYHIKNDEPTLAKVGNWGGKLAVRIPAEAADQNDIEKGDRVGVRVADDGCLELDPTARSR